MMQKVNAAVLLFLGMCITVSCFAAAVESMTEEEFSQQFRCPETFASEAEGKAALADSLKWYSAHNEKVTEEGYLSFRMRLLAQHRCDVALSNIAKSAIAADLTVPAYDTPMVCKRYAPKNVKKCVSSERYLRDVLTKGWSQVPPAAKSYCLSEALKANNEIYLNLINCISHEVNMR